MEGDVLRPAPGNDCSLPAMECASRWLRTPGAAELPLGALLAELAGAFAATGAGLALLPDGDVVAGPEEGTAEPTSLPWRERPLLLADVAQSPSALAVSAGGRSWLLAAVDGDGRASWLLWLEAPPVRQWSSAEAAALALAGEALSRRLRRPEGAPRWARQLL